MCDAHVVQRLFPGMHTLGTYRGFGAGGGIVTVLGEGWTLLEGACREFWVGCVARRHGLIVCVVNVYIPPRSSAYASAGSAFYQSTLEQLLEWVGAMRTGHGLLAATVVCGDFNARAGGYAYDGT